MTGLDALLSACTDRSWGTIVWGGVGYGAAITRVRALGARRYVYLEPNTALHERFSQKYVLSERETLSSNALWSRTEVRPLHVVSDPLRSSLLLPDALLQTWPNLRKIASYDVQTQSLDALAAEHEVSSEDHNLLVLDLCGAECEVLAGADKAVLARFTHIAIADADSASNEDPEWLQLLLSLGYIVHHPIGVPTDAWLLVRRDKVAEEVIITAEPAHVLRIRELEAELQESAQRTAQAETELQHTRQTMRMAVQMQAQRETDLTDLQARYRDGQDALERQHALLDKLGERLGLASDYFHELSASTDNGHSKLDSTESQNSTEVEKAGAACRGSGRVGEATKPKSRG